jgi:Glycosyl hydrolase catalytic core
VAAAGGDRHAAGQPGRRVRRRHRRRLAGPVHDRGDERVLRVDVITLHWYGSDFSAAAVGHQLTAFIRGSTQMLEALPYVQRYAWFGLPAVGDSADFGLYRDADTPTPAGKAYRAAG